MPIDTKLGVHDTNTLWRSIFTVIEKDKDQIKKEARRKSKRKDKTYPQTGSKRKKIIGEDFPSPKKWKGEETKIDSGRESSSLEPKTSEEDTTKKRRSEGKT